MKKKLLALLLILLTLFNTVGAYAADTVAGWLTLGYWPGETHRTITAEKLIEQSNATVSGGSVTIGADGSATWGFYIPYGARSVTINHEGTANIIMSSDGNEYAFSLTGENDGESNVLVFGDVLGRSAQARKWVPDALTGYKKEFVEHEGEKEITITTDSQITINSLVFEKEKLPGPTPVTGAGGSLVDLIVTPDISDYDRETLSTVLMDIHANIIVVNGMRRYIDNDNTSEIPYSYNGSVYLPVNTLAKALGYYLEEDASLGYVLLRSESHEVVLMDGVCTVQEGIGEVKDAPGNVILYRNGEPWGAVRYFAELNGDTVGYKDGLIVIDNKYTVEDILNDNGFFYYATGRFAGFKSQKKAGNTYYVAKTSNASDDNAGNKLAPFKTLRKAAEVAEAGDTVIVREGVYRETLTPKNSGTAAAPITFRAAEGENVVISAADPLGVPMKSDEVHKSGYDIYMAGLPESLGLGRDQIFINGEMMTQAVYPNGPNLLSDGSMSNAWPVRGNIHKFAGDGTTFKSDTLLNQTEEDYWKGSMWIGAFGNNYAHISGVVDSSSYGEFTVAEKYNPRWWWWSSFYKTPISGNALNFGCLIGHENAMDLPGEWVRTEDGQLRIILPEGLDPNTISLEAKARQLVVDLTNKKYINVEGFSTIGGSVTMNGSEMCMLNNMDMRYITHYVLSADQRRGYIDFPYNAHDENGAPQRGEVGIYVSGSDNVVVNSRIDHSAGCGLYLTGTGTYIENNELKDCGYTSAYVSGIHCDTVSWEKASTPRGGYAIYNNTIYNLGRSAIDFCRAEETDGTGGSHRNAIWLPNEIAYNDIHDAAMFTNDGGIIYANGVVLGLDEEMSRLHHNYVYKTKADEAAYGFGIYWDGNAHGCDTYNNLVFTKDEKGRITDSLINRHQILNGGGDSTARVYNNMMLGHVGLDADELSEYHYPEEKMFYAGTLDGDNRNMNYTRLKSGEADITYPAKDAALSDSSMTVGSDGYVTYTGDGQYVLFENVDFGTGANELELYLRGDWNWSNDSMTVYVGKTKDTAKAYPMKASIESYWDDETNTHGMMIDEVSGKQNIWIEVNTLHSVRLGGVSVWYHPNIHKTEEYTLFKYVIDRDEIKGSGGGSYMDFLSVNNAGGGVWPLTPSVKSVWSDCSAIYKDCVVEEDSMYFTMAAAARDYYNGQIVNVYIDDEEEPICSWKVRNLVFNDLETPYAIPFNDGRVLKAGTYDIRLEFTGKYENSSGKLVSKTSNANYFGFLKANTGSEEYIYKNEAGRFSDTLSSSASVKALYPVRDIRSGRQFRYNLINTYSGSVAGYENAFAAEDSSRFVINYFAEEGFAGQTVTVRLDDPESDPLATITTEETGLNSFVTAEAQLSKTVPAGEHTVYITFGGEAGAEKTCQLAWFGFGK